jgi:hypothetical protein
MNRDPVVQLLAPFAWVVLAAFLLGFAGVMALSAPILSQAPGAHSAPALVAAPDAGGWNARKAI